MPTDQKTQPAPIRSCALQVVERPIADLHPHPSNARTHSKKQIAQIAASIRQFGFVAPILLDDADSIIAGHGRVEAAKTLGMTHAPAIRLSHLTPAERRAYRLADNRLAELAGWDEALLAIELADLTALDLDFDLEITGFEGAQLDDLLDAASAESAIDQKADRIPEAAGPPVTRPGDLWVMGKHRLLCGDARDPVSYAALMGEERARMAFTDPPYNIAIDGNVSGFGRVARRDFLMGCGEMTKAEFTAFLTESMAGMAAASVDGAIHYVCMDWRHAPELTAAGEATGAALKNLIVWVKNNAGMGSFYRSQHELIFAFKVGNATHINTFGLGEGGRYRTNVWTYPAVSSFHEGQEADLAAHPTLKPVAMVVDAIKDVSRRGEIVLDPFGGSGTTLIAAHKTRRRVRLMELDPLYCDVICRRWRAFASEPAVLAATGQTFEEVALTRSAPAGGA